MSRLLPTLPHLLSLSHMNPGTDNYEQILASTWLPQLTVTAVEGMPATLAEASNSIKKEVILRCSLRLPPTLSSEEAEAKVRKIILVEGDEVYGAKVEIVGCHGGNGFDTKALKP